MANGAGHRVQDGTPAGIRRETRLDLGSEREKGLVAGQLSSLDRVSKRSERITAIGTDTQTTVDARNQDAATLGGASVGLEMHARAFQRSEAVNGKDPSVGDGRCSARRQAARFAAMTEASVTSSPLAALETLKTGPGEA